MGDSAMEHWQQRAAQGAMCAMLANNFIECVSGDIYPVGDVEKVFGVGTTKIGILVYNSWSTLINQGVVGENEIREALAVGGLPVLFKESIELHLCTVQDNKGELEEGPHHSAYTMRMAGVHTNANGELGAHDRRFSELPSGSLFSHIDWDVDTLTTLAGGA